MRTATWLAVAVGALLGCWLRINLQLLGADGPIFSLAWPNGLGCLIIGILTAYKSKFKQRHWDDGILRGLTIGFCGSLTTFSGWVSDTAASWFTPDAQSTGGRFFDATAHTVFTILIGIGAYTLGKQGFVSPDTGLQVPVELDEDRGETVQSVDSRDIVIRMNSRTKSPTSLHDTDGTCPASRTSDLGPNGIQEAGTHSEATAQRYGAFSVGPTTARRDHTKSDSISGSGRRMAPHKPLSKAERRWLVMEWSAIGLMILLSAVVIALSIVYYPPYVAASLIFAIPGAYLRWWLASALNGRLRLPAGTIVANLLGTVIYSVCFLYEARAGPHSSDYWHYNSTYLWLTALRTGFCGCLTTLSTLVFELDQMSPSIAWTYGVLSFLVAHATGLVVYACMPDTTTANY